MALNLPYTNKQYANIEITPLKKSSYTFFASKQYIKKHPLKDFNSINEHKLILPKSPSSKSKILIKGKAASGKSTIIKEEKPIYLDLKPRLDY